MAMEYNNNNNNCLPLPEELILEILLRLPVKSLLRFKCVSKSWFSLISDPNFANSHFQLSAAPTHRLLCFKPSEIQSINPNALFHDNVKLVLPFQIPSYLQILGSCRGFIMLHNYPFCFILWNPSTGAHKQISYSHIPSSIKGFDLLYDAILCGFGYDASKDDYVVVIAWFDYSDQTHFEFFSLRTNSWKNFEVALPDPHMDPAGIPGFFLNGAIHWLANPRNEETILAFDLMERKFSEIPLPYPRGDYIAISFAALGGCLSMCFQSIDATKVEIWVMREYKVQASWTMYEIFDSTFYPVCFAKGDEIIGLDGRGGLVKYNDKGELLERYADCHYRFKSTMYAESLLSLPNASHQKNKGRQVYRKCFEQLDVGTNQTHNDAKEGKRIRRAPAWTRDFICN